MLSVRFARCAAAIAALALAGCGSSGFGRDVKGFTQQTEVPAEQDVLRSIATYRTTADARLACSLITPGFLKSRFEDKPELCEAVARHQQKRELPERAEVKTIEGNTATVRVDEPTATKSLYKMERSAGTWRIDDIVEAP